MNIKDIKIQIPSKAAGILDTLHQAGFEGYIVGGCVRDFILGRDPQDWDITTNARPQEVKKLFKRTVDTGIKHGTVTVMLGKEGFEVTTYRIDGEYADHRHPTGVEFTGELTEDLKRRDFTINAMAYNEEDGLIDEFGGLEDLEGRIIRCVGDPMQRFDEDALRILRALRFSAQLSYDIDQNTCDAASKLAPTLSHVSAERIQTELLKLLVSPNPDRLMKAYEMGITRLILPELDECMKCPQNTPHHAYNVGEHLLVSCCNIAPVRHLRLSMLLHDIGKPLSRTTDEIGRDHFVGHAALSSGLAEKILRRLKMDTATIRKVCNLVRFHDIMMNMVPDEKKVRKMLHVLGPENLDDLIAVKRADISAQSDYERERKLEAVKMIEEIGHKVIERGDCLSLKSLSVTGKDLMEAGIAPGKELGEILEAMLSDVLVTPSHNDRDYLMIHLKNYENHR